MQIQLVVILLNNVSIFLIEYLFEEIEFFTEVIRQFISDMSA
jgi:hypothetical protein